MTRLRLRLRHPRTTAERRAAEAAAADVRAGEDVVPVRAVRDRSRRRVWWMGAEGRKGVK